MNPSAFIWAGRSGWVAEVGGTPPFGSSREVTGKGNSNPKFGLFHGFAKGVK